MTGDSVVVCSTVAGGTCSYCRAGYFAQCDNANPNGPVGQFAIASPILQGAGRVIAVGKYEDPVETIKKLTGGIGVDRAIDAVGVDAMHAHHGPAGEAAKEQEQKFAKAVQQVAPEQHPHDDGTFTPCDAPSQALEWAVDCIAKAGTLGIIGVYPPAAGSLPIGNATNKNLSINAGNCNHRAYIPKLVLMVRIGVIDPVKVLTKVRPLTDPIEAYGHFDKREAGWIATELNFAKGAE